MNREKTIIKTSFIGILVNLLLVGFKAFIGFLASSISIIMDAVNNLTDALSSLITIIGTKLSSKKPNKKHPYGYGRIEYITSMFVSFVILFAGGIAIYESIKAIIDGEKPTYDNWAIIIISVAIVVKVLLGLYFRHVGKKVSSDALKSSGTDALFDSILSISTLVALIISITTNVYIEAYLGIIIGLFIIKSGIEALKESLSQIIGERIEKEKADEIKEYIKNENPQVIGVYDLIINSYGPNKYIGSFHIEVNDDLTAKDIQLLERKIQSEMYEKYNIVTTVGIYASNNSTPLSNEIKEYTIDQIKNYNHIIQMHGFYVDEIEKYVFFDIIFDFDENNPVEKVKSLESKLKEKYNDFDFNIIIDRDYSE